MSIREVLEEAQTSKAGLPRLGDEITVTGTISGLWRDDNGVVTAGIRAGVLKRAYIQNDTLFVVIPS